LKILIIECKKGDNNRTDCLWELSEFPLQCLAGISLVDYWLNAVTRSDSADRNNK